jgi:hypothetical protein
MSPAIPDNVQFPNIRLQARQPFRPFLFIQCQDPIGALGGGEPTGT